MRLDRLELRNFGCYVNASVDLSPATVLIGPNDSGKSTILRAIRALATDTDSGGARFDFWDVSSRPVYATDWLETVEVLGTFADIPAEVAEAWGILAEGAKLRCGTWFAWQSAPDDLPGVRCIVVKHETADRLFVSESSEARFSASVETIAEQLWDRADLAPILPRIRVTESDVWLPWRYFEWPGRAALEGIGWESSAELEAILMRLAQPILKGVPFGDIRPFATEANLVEFPGPDSPPPAVSDVARPLLRRMISRRLSSSNTAELELALASLAATVDEQTEAFRLSLRAALERYTGHLGDVMLRRIGTAAGVEALVDLHTNDLFLNLTHERPADPRGWDSFSLDDLGLGARRAAALSVLELYGDPTVWSGEDWILLLIEEPEAGLAPAAQRRIASGLRSLPTYGVQPIVVTHSPAIVNAVSIDGLRVVTKGVVEVPSDDETVVMRNHQVTRPTSLGVVSAELGCSAADILLASRFVLVEGPSDAAVLQVWARKNGSDLDSSGIKLIPMKGFGPGEAIANILTAAIPNASFYVVLDSGSDTANLAAKLKEQFGQTVVVRILPRTEIEGFYTVDAVIAWLQKQVATEALDESTIREALEGPRRKRALQALSEEYLQRRYRAVEDGAAIAGEMDEGDIPPAIRGLLTEIADIQP